MPRVMTIGATPLSAPHSQRYGGQRAAVAYRARKAARVVGPSDRPTVVGPSDRPRRFRRTMGIQYMAPILSGHLGQTDQLPLTEPVWRTDWRHPPVTTPQEPQNLLRPTNKGCPDCLGALPAGHYRGRVAGLASHTGGSMQGRSLRGCLQGIALSSAGLGFGLDDLLCAGGAAATAAQTTYSYDTGEAGVDAALNIGTQIFGQAASSSCESDASSGSDREREAMEARYREEQLRQRREMDGFQSDMRSILTAQAQPAPSSGMSTTTMVTIGAVAVGVLALVLVLK